MFLRRFFICFAKTDEFLSLEDAGTMATENAADYTKTANLVTVATSGSYNDLLNKPEIPDVSNYYTKSEVGEGFVSSTFNVAKLEDNYHFNYKACIYFGKAVYNMMVEDGVIQNGVAIENPLPDDWTE